ncbi:hypothetical protein GGQ22_18170 [Nocardioides sp. zg-579]|uniref:Uncharacterized protein n=1 Tax=Nocardioides marmotae TaxID=2663857 RepID=A0A6I3JGD1_9ACTN|nr:hypothetical protein [Nocardioides marmotae]MCR6033346.1 hypothetical protein [Gordonia jinghuaiqii]MTB97003.1 hypothetical protein [Nocardioides marmotae]QKE00619.1 hypothetical protein HPC71_05635 [Nocardioides marmotae]
MTQTPLSQAGPSASLRPPPWSYAWWALTGAVVGFGVVGLLTIGIFLLPVGLALLVVGCLWKPLQNSSATAAVGGLAAAPLYLAWVNRDGPGTVCETLADGTSCAERWSPWPFLAVAVVLVAVSVTAVTKTRRAR